MLSVTVRDDRIHVGERFSFTLQRTLRLPDDGRTYPLPPGFGPFLLHQVDDYAKNVPSLWRKRGGFFVPIYQREALWLQFAAAWWKPNAVKVSAGGINAVSGESWHCGLHADPQNYIICPDQPWLDGINASAGVIRQFVAVPLGSGDTIEEQLTGTHELAGIQLQVFEPKPGKFPDTPPPGGDICLETAYEAFPTELGVAVGGRMHQKIYPDKRGVETWDQENYAKVFINIINSEQYYAITGRELPSPPLSPKLYTDMGLPWFSLYDEERGDVAGSEQLRGVKSLAEGDSERGEVSDRDNQSLRIEPSQTIYLKPNTKDE
jgi:hypothetical protein